MAVSSSVMAALAATMSREIGEKKTSRHKKLKGMDVYSKTEDWLGADEPHLVRTLRGHRGGVTSVAFSPAKRQVVSGGMDACVMLWQFGEPLKKAGEETPRGGRPTRAFRLIGHRGPVHRVTFSPNGSEVASASADRCVRLWQPSARGDSVELKGHSGGVRSVDYSPDGSRLMTASDDKTVKVWSLPSRKFCCALGASRADELAEPTSGVSRFTGARGGGAAAHAHANWVRCARWSPDGRVAASCGDDKLVKLWDVESRRCARTFFDHEASVQDVVFSYDGTCLVSAGDDKQVNVWDARSYALIQHYSAHQSPVSSLAIDRSGRYLASTSHDSTLKLYDLRQGQLLYTLRGHRGAVSCSAFEPNETKSQLFATGGADRVVMIWRAKLDDCFPTDKPRSAPRRQPAQLPTKTIPIEPAKQPSPQPNPKVDRFSPPKERPQPLDATEPRHVDLVLEDFVAKADTDIGEAYDAPDDHKRRSFPNLREVARQSDDIPETVAATLDHIVGQLSVVTSTLGMLEQRLSITENRLAALTFAEHVAPPPVTSLDAQCASGIVGDTTK